MSAASVPAPVAVLYRLVRAMAPVIPSGITVIKPDRICINCPLVSPVLQQVVDERGPQQRLRLAVPVPGRYSRHSATASSMVGPIVLGAPSSAAASSASGRCRSTDQKKPTSMMLSGDLRRRARAVPRWTARPARRTRRVGHDRERSPPPGGCPGRSAGRCLHRSVSQASARLSVGCAGRRRPGVGPARRACRCAAAVAAAVRLPRRRRRSPAAGRPNVSTSRVTTRPAADRAGRDRDGRDVPAALDRVIAGTAISRATASTVPKTPPRRPYALVPPSSAAPTARPVHSRPVAGTTGPVARAAISTPAPAASGIDSAMAPAVSTAATGPGAGPGRRPGGTGRPSGGPA